MASHTAVINDSALQFSYLESSAPSTEDYTTLVCVHGNTFHKEIFRRLLPLAGAHNLRVVAVNRRGYPGSSPYTDEELASLSGKEPAAQSNFMRERALELASFVAWLINHLDIPRASPTGGGIALLGWSLGNITTMALLRFLPTFPEEIRAVVETHLRSLIIYDTTAIMMGYANPQDMPLPRFYKLTSPSERFDAFSEWCSAYYPHPFFRQEDKLPRDATSLIHDCDNQLRPSTYETMSVVERAACTYTVAGGIEQSFLSFNPSTFYDITLGTFLADHASLSKPLLPNLKINYVYCEASIWSSVFGAWNIEDNISKWKEEKRKLRLTSIRGVKGANHFFHWDEPSSFLDLVQEVLYKQP